MNKDLLATLLVLLAQYTPQLVKDGIDLITGLPRQAGEDDASYLARLEVDITQKLDTAQKKTQQVVDDTKPGS